jgi:hypothetical protein
MTTIDGGSGFAAQVRASVEQATDQVGDPHLKAQKVVATALRAHERGNSVKVVGGFYIVLTLAGRFAPRGAVTRIMGRLLQPTSDQPVSGDVAAVEEPIESAPRGGKR